MSTNTTVVQILRQKSPGVYQVRYPYGRVRSGTYFIQTSAQVKEQELYHIAYSGAIRANEPILVTSISLAEPR